MNRKISERVKIVIFAIFFMLPLTVLAQTDSDSPPTSAVSAEVERVLAISRLQQIKLLMSDKREQLGVLRKQLKSAQEVDKARIEEQIGELQQNMVELTQTFDRVAVSGVNLSSLADAEESQLDWREELLQIARPILDSLKEATAKPRKIEELRSSITQYTQQLEAADKAIASIRLYDQYDMSAEVITGLNGVAASWLERRADIENALEVARFELQNLDAEDTKILESIGNIVHDFGVGRGLTLLIALVIGIAVWFFMRALRWLVNRARRSPENRVHAAKFRLVLYAYHLVSILLIVLAVLSVFYVRGDLLLLSLAIIAFAMLTLGTWRLLPGYVQEARLLINAGAAREKERVIYNGLPFRIESLNLFSVLRNPELDGILRLPLSALAEMTSRQSGDEAWFPSSTGDYLLLPDGGFAQVLQQTVELVRLKRTGSLIQFSTADFLQLNVRNLSREGFGVIVVFGIDYEHQGISLDRVPERFMSGLTTAFESAEFGDDLKDLLVDFKEAGTNSLDYLVYATMDGGCANSYFTIQRLIQKTCVDICNQEGWGIPFTQVTIHQAGPGETHPGS